MGYHKILAGLADAGTAPRVMAAAAALAREHDAQLIAVHVVPGAVTREGGMPVEDLTDQLRQVYEQEYARSPFAGEWRVIDDATLSPVGTLIELGNACDIVVLGQRHADQEGRTYRHLGEHVVGICARPVLLIPEAPRAAFACDEVLLAWDGSPAATRVAFDALPLLQHAANVRVHRFNPPANERGTGSGIAEAFVDTLARHGVSVELSHSDIDRLEVGEQVLSLAAERGSQLIVGGCRPRSRVRELLFGDTTHHLLAHSTLPLLMSG